MTWYDANHCNDVCGIYSGLTATSLEVTILKYWHLIQRPLWHIVPGKNLLLPSNSDESVINISFPFFLYFSQWLLKTNARKIPKRDMEKKAKVFFIFYEIQKQKAIEELRVTCSVSSWTKRTVNVFRLFVCLRGQSEPCTLHCGFDWRGAGGLRPLGPARDEGHGGPMVRWGLVMFPCILITS